jgi:5,10-methenyltetrahydrofolate synthetase
LNSATHGAPLGARQALRKTLLARREQFVAGPGFDLAAAALSCHLVGVLSELEPELLGLYWPQRGEFNAAHAVAADSLFTKRAIALPFAQRTPVRMQYRAWDGRTPTVVDECGIPASEGPPVLPDVVLVPCVGYTAEGYRLGYGGGYFDRWLADHPDVTAVGVAWRVGEIAAGDFVAEAHDLPLTFVVTEDGVA